jgi:hypothetical protein
MDKRSLQLFERLLQRLKQLLQWLQRELVRFNAISSLTTVSTDRLLGAFALTDHLKPLPPPIAS